MRAFPGYTRQTLEAEEAGLVQRMQIVLSEEGKEQAAQQRRAKRR